jgi:hypothetical protein
MHRAWCWTNVTAMDAAPNRSSSGWTGAIHAMRRISKGSWKRTQMRGDADRLYGSEGE